MTRAALWLRITPKYLVRKRLIGNSVEIGDGPAAVTGDVHRNEATLLVFDSCRARLKRGRRETAVDPEVRRPARCYMIFIL